MANNNKNLTNELNIATEDQFIAYLNQFQTDLKEFCTASNHDSKQLIILNNQLGQFGQIIDQQIVLNRQNFIITQICKQKTATQLTALLNHLIKNGLMSNEDGFFFASCNLLIIVSNLVTIDLENSKQKLIKSFENAEMINTVKNLLESLLNDYLNLSTTNKQPSAENQRIIKLLNTVLLCLTNFCTNNDSIRLSIYSEKLWKCLMQLITEQIEIFKKNTSIDSTGIPDLIVAAMTIMINLLIGFNPTKSDTAQKEFLAAIHTLLNFWENLFELCLKTANLTDLVKLNNQINDFYWQCHSQRDQIVNSLIKIDFISKICLLFKNIDTPKKLFSANQATNYEFLYSSMIIFANYSNGSKSLIEELVEKGISSACRDRIVSLKLEKHDQNFSNDEKHKLSKLIEIILNIITNICDLPSNRMQFRKDESFKQSLVQLTGSENKSLLVAASECLAYIVTEKEVELLEQGGKSFESILIIIRQLLASKTTASSSNSNEGRFVWIDDTRYGLSRLLKILHVMTTCDQIKSRFADSGGLDDLQIILKTSRNTSEITKSLEILWNISFDHEVAKKCIIENHPDLIKLIEQFRNGHGPEASRAVEGFMWEINQINKQKNTVIPHPPNNPKPETTSKSHAKKLEQAASKAEKTVESESKHESSEIDLNKFTYDIFISYSHREKSEIVLKIRDFLRKEGLKVWIDEERMRGSIMTAMAEGLEKSRLVLMCTSEAYQTSAYCRAEAEYAFTLRRPIVPLLMQDHFMPTGWLGIIQGTKLYYEFFSNVKFNSNVKKLNEEIKKIFNETKTNMQQKIDSSDELDNVSVKDTTKWKVDNVKKWLNENGLGQCDSTITSKLDGPLLEALLKMRFQTTSEYFQKNILKKDLKLTNYVDILRFELAVDNLTNQTSVSSKNESKIKKASNISESAIGKLKSWSKIDVEKWINEVAKNFQNKTALMKIFSHFDGPLLNQLVSMKERSSAEYFYEVLRIEFNLPLLDLLVMEKKLSELNKL